MELQWEGRTSECSERHNMWRGARRLVQGGLVCLIARVIVLHHALVPCNQMLLGRSQELACRCVSLTERELQHACVIA